MSILKLFSDPLAIDVPSKTETVKENGEVSFRCKANGIPSAILKWYFEDVELGKFCIS